MSGKSTFINTLVESDRMIVSEVPGTTRDSVDVRFELDGHAFLAIDTPGVRKRKSMRQDIEYYGLHRAQRSIRRADVVLLFFDAQEEISAVDKQLCKYIEDQFKPCIFVVNKWDLLVKRAATGDWAEYLRDTFPTQAYVPIAFITAQTGKNVKKLLNHAQMLFKQSRERVGTGELNRLVRRAVAEHPPPVYRNRNPKVFYATQAADATADDRAEVQRAQSVLPLVPPLPAERAPRRTPVRGSPDPPALRETRSSATRTNGERAATPVMALICTLKSFNPEPTATAGAGDGLSVRDARQR